MLRCVNLENHIDINMLIDRKKLHVVKKLKRSGNVDAMTMLGIFYYFYKAQYNKGVCLLFRAHRRKYNLATYALAVVQQINSKCNGFAILAEIAAEQNAADILHGLRVKFLRLVPNPLFGLDIKCKMLCNEVAYSHWLHRPEIPELYFFQFIECIRCIIDIEMATLCYYAALN